MADWVNVALPIASLIVGSLLTMANQALTDRRVTDREERARRDQFKTANFEMHRTAMLEMQEIVRDCYDALVKESQRRATSGDYEYFDSRPWKAVQTHEAWQIIDYFKSVSNLNEMSKDERSAFLDELATKIRITDDFTKESLKLVENSSKIFERRFPFWEEFTAFIRELRLRMYRSGSNSVVNSGENFIQAVAKWNEHLATAGTKELFEQVRASRYELDRALSNSLKLGPYETS